MTPAAVVAGLCAVGYLTLCDRPQSLIRSAIKTASVALLAVSVALAGGPVLLIVALGFCAVGDWLLSRPGEPAFMAGIGAFAAGHLAYVALFLGHPQARMARWTEMPQPLFIAGLIGVGLIAARVLGPRAGALRGPVLAYVPVILAMGVAVLVLPASGRLALAAPAAALFILSDLVLAAESFVLSGRHPVRAATPYVVWGSYWLAQLGLHSAFV